MVFQLSNPDYELSPYTGMTRQGWIEAGEYLLEGIFRHINSMNAPVIVPRQEWEVSYPGGDNVQQQMAERFEGLARSFLIAAPLIHIKPELVISSIGIREYYRQQVLSACTETDPNWVGSYEYLQRTIGREAAFATFQQTVETCALVIGLRMCKTEIWDSYTAAEKDRIAGFLSAYAHGNTVPQNWRWFNMLVLAFLHGEGYAVDQNMMREHGQAVLNYYAGDGWYRDGHSFDYYSCWAFQVYAPIWNNWYGYEHEPYLAQQFEANSNELMESYGDFFDRDGFTNMWGRSNIYRNAATSAFDGNLMLRCTAADPGQARRIASGSLLQFLTREDFRHDGVPALGFYGQFKPLVQGYSCAESPFWMGKAFLCLHLPETHPFWTAKEHNGTWEQLGPEAVKVTTLNGPGLCFTNHGANGETILRTGKVLKQRGDEHGMWNYAKLCYNTKYPWEAAPSKAVEAQQYVLKDLTTGTYEKANVTFWHGQKSGVLYRRQFFEYDLTRECHGMQAINLADIAVPCGIIRADKLRLCRRPVEVTLGAYGFPDNGTEIRRLQQGKARAILLKGHDLIGQERQMAMTIYDGWDEIDIIYSRGTNPDSPASIVIYGKLVRKVQFGYEPYVLISQVITKESWDEFKEEEIFPVESVTYADKEGYGGYGPVTISLKHGESRIIKYEKIEGNLQL